MKNKRLPKEGGVRVELADGWVLFFWEPDNSTGTTFRSYGLHVQATGNSMIRKMGEPSRTKRPTLKNVARGFDELVARRLPREIRKAIPKLREKLLQGKIQKLPRSTTLA